MKTKIFHRLLYGALALAPASAISREPIPSELPLTDERRQSVAQDLVNQSVVIADGVIVWSDKGRQAFHGKSRSAIKSVPIAELFPKLQATKILKGPALSEYLLTTSADGPYGIYEVPSGSSVRLLLLPIKTKRGITIWEIQDTSRTFGRLIDERTINAEIDQILGSRRPSDLTFSDEPPEP